MWELMFTFDYNKFVRGKPWNRNHKRFKIWKTLKVVTNNQQSKVEGSWRVWRNRTAHSSFMDGILLKTMLILPISPTSDPFLTHTNRGREWKSLDTLPSWLKPETHIKSNRIIKKWCYATRPLTTSYHFWKPKSKGKSTSSLNTFPSSRKSMLKPKFSLLKNLV